MKYFTDKELMCKCGCGTLNVNPVFLEALELTRSEYGKPMMVTSGARCKAHNKKVGGAANSYHIGEGKECCAVDVKRPNETDTWKLIFCAMKHGLSVRVGSNFVHLDGRETPTFGTYYE